MWPSPADPAIQSRMRDILSRMTLAEKIGQMTQADRQTCTPDEASRYHLGSILSAAGSCPGENRCADWVAMNDAYWQAVMSSVSDNQAVPILYGLDAVHGNSNVRGATIFPHNIGLGAAHDPALLAQVAKATAKEVLASGVDWTFSPNLAIASDYRWGRTYESYASDPQRVAEFGGIMIRHLQDTGEHEGVLACAKHWVGDGGTSLGIDQGDTQLDWQTLERLHITPYYRALEAGALTVMASFSSWNGVKCHAHKHLLTDILKVQMGFQGFIISDMQGIDYLADDVYLSVAKAVNAGIDMFMMPENWKLFIEYLHRHVEMGTVPMARIDDAVGRILAVKLAMGLFEKPRPAQRAWSNHPSFGSPEHRQIAREAVRKSQVLLKNADCLPLNKGASILVAGKNADNCGHQCGGFTVEWQGVVGNAPIEGGTSVWQGIQAIAPNAILSNTFDASDVDPRRHDVAIVVIGETPYAEGMGDIRDSNAGFVASGSSVDGQLNLLHAFGDSLNLDTLFPRDMQLVENLVSKGVPVVAVLLTGRPLVIDRLLALASAVVCAWLPGSEGQGVADTLFGDYDFTGRLAFDWPALTNKTVSDEHPNQFPKGFGLGYSRD